MLGGLRGTASRLALAAVFCVMGAAVFLQKPAKAADLGGDCCADLEERVAELEATTARKGNKKVTVILYGKVNKAVEFWDDGAEKNTYVVDNYNESSRFGFKGSAKISGDWSAGYRLEVEIRNAASSKLNQIDDDNAADPLRSLNVRQSNMYLANKAWGELRWGLTNTPKFDSTKDTMEFISTEPGEGGGLSDTMVSDDRMNQSFFLRPKGFNNAKGLSKLRWSDIARCYSGADDFNCSTRRNGVAYWSPDWYGFTASAGWFEDDIWGAALRYRKAWGETFKVGASIGYEKILDERLQNGGGGLAGFRRDIDEWSGSASIKHLPTGLFAFTAFSFSDNNDSNTQHAGIFTGTSDPQMSAWDARLGIQRKMPWFGVDKLGETSFFVGFINVQDGIGAGTLLGRIPANRLITAGTFANVPINTEITGSNVDEWYLGFDQGLESASMHLYAVFQHFTPDVSLVDAAFNHVPAPLDDFNVFYTGARLYF